MTDSWRVVYVEDEAKYREQVKEYLEGASFPYGPLSVLPVASFAEARGLLADRKVDLLILDVFDAPIESHDDAGLKLLELWKETGFAPVVLYTALPKDALDAAAPFVHIVGKDAGVAELLAAIGRLFDGRVPQTHRAIAEHIEGSLRKYMWNFVSANWEHFEHLTTQPEFLRLLLARLASELGNNLQPVLERAYGASHKDPAPHAVHPAAYYIKPPVGTDALMGDLRIVENQLMFVLWPSCDMVMRDKVCKVDSVLCARTIKLQDTDEFRAWNTALTEKSEEKKKKAKKSLDRLFRNQRLDVQSERYHFLPKVWDISAVLVDFADLHHVPVKDLLAAKCLATVASPFAESVSARFLRYIARIGTPDLDMDIVIESL
jgi:CheY-like chemotaxis protein